MSRVEDLHEILDSSWCDRAVLLQNPVAGPEATHHMLRDAKRLGLRVVIEYDLGYHPQGGDYVCAVAGPWAYLDSTAGEECVASDWSQLFSWVRRHQARDGDPGKPTALKDRR